MLPSERIEKIQDMLRSQKTVKVEDLSNAFNVSIMTIRRDIEKLEQKGLAKRCYGGIVQNSSFAQDMGYKEKEILNQDSKRFIARYCFEHLLPERGIIYLDTGSTVLELAKLLRDNLTNEQCQALTIITNDIIIANLLLNKSFKLIMIGGNVQNPLGCIHGYTAMNQLQNLRIDTAFVGGLSIDADLNLFAASESKVFFRRQLVENSNYCYLMIDSSKIYRQSLFCTHCISAYSAVISDRDLAASEKDLAQKKEIDWINANAESRPGDLHPSE